VLEEDVFSLFGVDDSEEDAVFVVELVVVGEGVGAGEENNENERAWKNPPFGLLGEDEEEGIADDGGCS
jgi:hypothetical protein